jgi:magnesium and cobalt exporter, CNNM family
MGLFIILLLLIMLNGLFAMAETSIVSARKSRLRKEANEGDGNAQIAMDLIKNPARFLSTVQIGITFIGIFVGAYGGEALSHGLADDLKVIPLIGVYSQPIALFIIVAITTYISLIVGELVPKRIALTRPEKIAKLAAGPMSSLSRLAAPLVSFLTVSSDVIMSILRIKPSSEPKVSPEEVNMLIQEGTNVGIFNREEKDIVERTFQLDEKKIISFMTPRKEIIWLEKESSFDELSKVIVKYPHSYFPVCRDSLDNVLGIVRTEDLLTTFMIERKIEFSKSLHKPIYVPETMEAWKVLELFKQSGIHTALVVDEYGSILGLLSLADILEEIVGDIPNVDELEEKEIMKRKDGSYIIDGLITIDEFKEYFKVSNLPDEQDAGFNTIGGFAMARLDKIPAKGDSFDVKHLHFEIAEMDGNRVDKILVTTLPSHTTHTG